MYSYEILTEEMVGVLYVWMTERLQQSSIQGALLNITLLVHMCFKQGQGMGHLPIN